MSILSPVFKNDQPRFVTKRIARAISSTAPTAKYDSPLPAMAEFIGNRNVSGLAIVLRQESMKKVS